MIPDEATPRRKIYSIRSQQVMLDYDLAEIYGYSTSSLNQKVSKNIEKFDSDFMFELTKDEFQYSAPQNVITSWGVITNITKSIYYYIFFSNSSRFNSRLSSSLVGI